jgi:pyruvate carboxylase
MKNYLIIALLLLSFGFPQKMLNKKVMIEEKLSNNDEIIVYPPNSDNPYNGVVYWYGGVAQLNHQTYNNGIKNGPYKEWYVIGKEKILILVGNYKNGEKMDYGLIIMKMRSGKKEILWKEKKMDYGFITTIKVGSGKKKHTSINI